MRAMVLDAPGRAAARRRAARARAGPGQLLIRVHACGVCRTDLHVLDGEVALPPLPRRARPPDRRRRSAGTGERVGVPWLGWTCGDVPLLPRGPREPVRPRALHRLRPRRRLRRVRGRRRALLLPDPRRLPGPAGRAAAVRRADRPPRAADGRRRRAPRPLRLRRRGAHRLPGRPPRGPARVRVHARRRRRRAQRFARELGAEWAGPSGAAPPEPLDAAIIFAPVGALVPAALRALAKGGTVVCAGIHMSDIPSFPYADLWGERVDPLGRQPDPPRRRGVPRARAGRAGPHDRDAVPARRRRTTRSRTSAPAGSRAPPSSTSAEADRAGRAGGRRSRRSGEPPRPRRAGARRPP